VAARFVAVVICCSPALLPAQSLFDPPVPPVADGATSRVRGVTDLNAATTGPYQAAGAEGAPAATFVAPSQEYPPDINATRPEPPAAAPADVGPTEQVPIDGAEVIARVDGQVILASDILWQVNQLIAMASAKQPIPPDQIPIAQKALTERLLLGLIDTKLLYADFRRTVPAENIPKVEESISEPFEKVEIPRLVGMMNVQDRSELDGALRKQGTSLKEVQRQFAEKTIAGEWLKQRMPKSTPITYESLLAYYQDHPKEFEIVAEVDWEELMVRFDRCNGDRNEAWRQICALGNEAYQAAVANPEVRGAVFAGVAKAKSHGVTASLGGLYEHTSAGALKCEALNNALAQLAVGQFSDPIESELGFHIVRVLKRVEAGRRPFTEAQADIRRHLEQEQRTSALMAEIKTLRTASRVWTTFHGDLNGPQVAELLEANDERRR
jgi:peptidyl-prolyl cis-trans isomerase SurA